MIFLKKLNKLFFMVYLLIFLVYWNYSYPTSFCV